MTRGVVTKVVRSVGSEWGRVRVAGTGTDCFFNRQSLRKQTDFEALAIGQEVKFDEQPDPINGATAARLSIVATRGPEAASGPGMKPVAFAANAEEIEVKQDGRR